MLFCLGLNFREASESEPFVGWSSSASVKSQKHSKTLTLRRLSAPTRAFAAEIETFAYQTQSHKTLTLLRPDKPCNPRKLTSLPVVLVVLEVLVVLVVLVVFVVLVVLVVPVPKIAILETTTKLPETGVNFNYWILEATKHAVMFENTTRLQATGGKFKLLKPPNILLYLKIQKLCHPQGRILILEATKYVVMFETTTRLQATGEIQVNILQFLKIEQDGQQRKKI